MNNKIELKENQRLITVHYDSLENLLSRKEYIINLLKDYISKFNENDEFVEKDYISIGENYFLLNIIVTKKD